MRYTLSIYLYTPVYRPDAEALLITPPSNTPLEPNSNTILETKLRPPNFLQFTLRIDVLKIVILDHQSSNQQHLHTSELHAQTGERVTSESG